MIVLDVLKPITHKLLIEKELEGFGIRLNKSPPKLTFKRKDKGGISFVSHWKGAPRLTREEVLAVCNEYRRERPCALALLRPCTRARSSLRPCTHTICAAKHAAGLWHTCTATEPHHAAPRARCAPAYERPPRTPSAVSRPSFSKPPCTTRRVHNADIEMRGDHDVDDLVDVVEGGRVYLPALYVLNKIDQARVVPPPPLVSLCTQFAPRAAPPSVASTVARVSAPARLRRALCCEMLEKLAYVGVDARLSWNSQILAWTRV